MFTAFLASFVYFCNMRPQVFSFVLFALFYWVLDGYRHRRRDRLWLLPPLMILWVNLHGAFALGLGLTALFLASETVRRVIEPSREDTLTVAELRRLGLVLAICASATLVNPETYRLYDYVRVVMSDPASQQFVVEWQPPRVNTLQGALLFYGLFFLALGALLYARKRANLTDLALFVEHSGAEPPVRAEDVRLQILIPAPLNAVTPIPRLRSWITSNAVFFDRNQGDIPQEPVSTADWRLFIEGLVEEPFQLTYDQITQMPKAIVSNTLECSGNGRSLLSVKASGNPWTIGGVGNAVWGGVWLRDFLAKARPKPEAKHVAFQGMDKPVGSSGVPFIRSIPLEKAMSSTILAYEMNGEPLPLKHGYPLRALALGWTGANCAKWLHKITLMDRPYERFFHGPGLPCFSKRRGPQERSGCESH